mgnify:CR=1 FL=1|jgi:hypothetical protein
MKDLDTIKKGDRILFRAPTVGTGNRKAVRLVVATWPDAVLVKSYNGWGGFVVKPWEILEHYPAQEKGAAA